MVISNRHLLYSIRSVFLGDEFRGSSGTTSFTATESTLHFILSGGLFSGSESLRPSFLQRCFAHSLDLQAGRCAVKGQAQPPDEDNIGADANNIGADKNNIVGDEDNVGVSALVAALSSRRSRRRRTRPKPARALTGRATGDFDAVTSPRKISLRLCRPGSLSFVEAMSLVLAECSLSFERNCTTERTRLVRLLVS